MYINKENGAELAICIAMNYNITKVYIKRKKNKSYIALI